MKPSIIDEEKEFEFLERSFETIDPGHFNEVETRQAVATEDSAKRPYFEKFREKLEDGFRLGCAPGVATSRDMDLIVRLLAVPQYPLLEKLNLFLLYQDWRKSTDLVQAAKKISLECQEYLKLRKAGPYSRQLEKRRGDLLAQIFRECGGKQRYLGIDMFISMF